MTEVQLQVSHGDLLEGTCSVMGSSVDLVVTSAPYKDENGYSEELMHALARICDHGLKPGGRVFMNFGQLRGHYDRPFQARQAFAEESGLVPGQTIAWVKSLVVPNYRRKATEQVKAMFKHVRHEDLSRKELLDQLGALLDHLEGPGEALQAGHYQPITLKSPTLNYCWEFLFTFYKPPELPLDRIALGVPFTDPTNARRGTRGKNGGLHCAGDTWFIPYKTTGATKKKVSAGLKDAYSFPEELVERCIKLANLEPGSTVMDPFSGGGTTACVAKRLGHHAIAIDRDSKALQATYAAWISEGGEDGEEAL